MDPPDSANLTDLSDGPPDAEVSFLAGLLSLVFSSEDLFLSSTLVELTPLATVFSFLLPLPLP